MSVAKGATFGAWDPLPTKSFEDLPKAVKARVPRSQIIKITEQHSTSENRFWEPGWEVRDPADHKVLLRVYYGENIFEAESERVSWEFLDNIGVAKTHMLKNYRIHGDQDYTAGQFMGEDGPVFAIGWHRLEHSKHPARFHLHRDAVQIKVRSGDKPAEWTKITDIEGLEVKGGRWDWIIRPTQEESYYALTDFEKYLLVAQTVSKESSSGP